MESNITFQVGDDVESYGYCVMIVVDHVLFTRRGLHCRVWDIVDYSESVNGSHVRTCYSLESAKMMLRDIVLG